MLVIRKFPLRVIKSALPNDFQVFFHTIRSPRQLLKHTTNYSLIKRGLQDWRIGDVVKHLLREDVNKVLVMAGAGISTPSGIPDFRSPGTGLYDNLQKYNLPYPEAVFDIEYFNRDPQPFYSLARELYPGKYRPNRVHHFCALLHKKKKLLRMYTQNIDGLEQSAGIPTEMLVEAHGSFRTATCTSCRKSYDGLAIRDEIMNQKIPKCSDCQGVLKPDVVFFGENLSDRFLLHMKDVLVADTLLVLGTSLEVEPFARLATLVDEEIPRILINNTAVRSFVLSDSEKDVILLGDVEETIKTLSDQLGWREELEKMTITG